MNGDLSDDLNRDEVNREYQAFPTSDIEDQEFQNDN